MGAKQSTSQPQNEISQEDVKRLLESQRKLYEEKCRQLVKQVSELQQTKENSPATANTAQTANPPAPASAAQNVTMQQSAAPANPPQPANLQPIYPQLPQQLNHPNVNPPSHPLAYSNVSNPPYFPQQGYPQFQHFGPQNKYGPAPPAFSLQAGPQNGFGQQPVFPQQMGPQTGPAQQPLFPQQMGPQGGFAQQQQVGPQGGFAQQQQVGPQAGPAQQQRPSAPPLPPIPARPSQLVHPQPAQSPPQPATNTGNVASKPNITRPLPAVPSAPPAPREWSQSRPRSSSREGNELDCVTCGSPLGVGIFRCNRGHNSCVNCKRSGKRCKVCFQAILNIRNYDLELKAAQRKVACPNKEDGCVVFVKLSEMDSHTTSCPFQPQKCPLSSVFGNCDWTGQLNKMSGHFKSLHPSQRQTNVDTELQLQNVTKNSRQLVLVVLGVYNFVLHVKVAEPTRKIFMAVQLIGTQKSAEKWIYEIHVYNKDEANRKYTFTDTCSSSSGSVENIFNQRQCAVLPFAYATTFVYKNVLTYKVYIKKIEDPNEKPKRVRKRNKNSQEL